MADNVKSLASTKLKRSRICGPQSKHGCLTCKARRVKCDEAKPGCVRCAESRRFCAGYPKRYGVDVPASTAAAGQSTTTTVSKHSSLVKPKLAWALQTGCTATIRQHQCAQLAVQLLTFDAFGSFGSSSVVVDILLPQMCHSIPSVNAAAVALGAVHEIQASYHSASSDDRAFAVSQYQSALGAMRRDLVTQPDGPMPLIMVCFMLSVAELFLQQEINALIHLHGAFRLLQHQKDAKMLSLTPQSDTAHFSPEDHLELLLYIIDFGTSSYAMSRLPELTPPHTSPILPPLTSLSSAHIILTHLVHTAWTFTATNYKYKYHPQFTPPTIYISQGQLIAHLTTWLSQFNLTILPPLRRQLTTASTAKLYIHALTLRITALSSLIYLACILTPYQCAYDAHASRFQQIIADAEAILSSRPQQESVSSVKGVDGQRFTTGPGLIQPLFFTAYKYRDQTYRRRAIRLLEMAGREGPWFGKREALATLRIVELEEKCVTDYTNPTTTRGKPPSAMLAVQHASDMLILAQPMSPNADQPIISSPSSIPEETRIHGMGIKWVPRGAVDEKPSNLVMLRLTRCADLEKMLGYDCGHGPGEDGGLETHRQGPCENNVWWEIWEEVLEVPTNDER